ncbi:MAG: hypothetical protein PHO56_02590 [Patescibacteria group bacterium]|nr:hypothetical protein [Patescibacteria group bacterium]
MAKITNDKLSLVKNFYLSDNLSAREIAEKLNVSSDAVYYFLRKYKIPRRDYTERNKVEFVKKRPSFKIKNNLNANEKELKTAGVMLYWGEGSKWEGEKIVDFTNSNKDMIAVFIKFLRNICGIDENRLRVYLYCYANQNAVELKNFWSKSTGIPQKYFYKPYIRKDFNPEKSEKMKNGLIHIRYNDKKLLLTIKNWIDEFIDKNC